MIIIFCLLAACGGGGDGASDAFDVFDNVADLDVTLAEQLPTGSAEYRGKAVLDLPLGAQGADVSYVGDMAVSVDFSAADQPFTGMIDGLASDGQGPLDGQLVISNAIITPDASAVLDYQIAADVAGTLSGGGASYQLEGDLFGDFLGRNADATAGVIFGDITGPDGVNLFDGSYAAVID